MRLVSPRSNVSAVVLVGAYEWGKSPFDRLRPRPLLPVAQIPVVCYALDWLSQAAVDSAAICVNSETQRVREVLGQGTQHSLPLEYVTDATPRGPAGCVRDAAERTNAHTLVVVDGTTIPSFELEPMLAVHRAQKAALTVVVHQEGSTQSRPGGAFIPGGIYILDRAVLDHIPAQGFQDIKEGLIPRLYDAGARVVTHVARGASPQILNAGTYLSVNHWMIESLMERPVTVPDYHARGQVMAHSTARIAGDARIVGPVVIGPGATVAKDATIVGPAAIGADCTVESHAVVSRSVAWARCTVSGGALVDNCILADDAVVPKGGKFFGALMASPAPGRGGRRLLDEPVLQPVDEAGATSPWRPQREEPARGGLATRLFQHYSLVSRPQPPLSDLRYRA